MSDPNAPQQPSDPHQQPAGAGQQPGGPSQYPQQPPQYGQQPPQYGQQPYAAPPLPPLSPESDKTAATWAHVGGIIGFLPSLIIWLVLKDRGPRTNVEAKEALNWQITFTIVYVALVIVFDIIGLVLWPLAFLGWLLPLAWWILNIVFSIVGGVRVNAGGSYRYPFNFRFIR